MAYHIEKETGDIVVDGFEQGIASSPHKGLANIQNANIATQGGEVMASFARAQQTMTNSVATGSLTFLDSTHVNLSIASTNNLFKGNWITVTGSSNTSQLPNGTYYVPPSTGSGFQLANYYNTFSSTLPATISYLLVAGGGGGATSSTTTSAGGGGGGKVLIGTTSVTAQAYPIVIGSGGAADTNGVASTAFSLTAPGGVKGTINNGGNSGAGKTGGPGNDGGGGGAGDSVNGSAGAVGFPALGGNGGTGTVSSISGTAVTYGDGGGGGSLSNTVIAPATGGSGNGGLGGVTTPSRNGGNAVANTGSGGGGANSSASGSGGNGGTGSAGIAYITYPSNSIIGATGGTISFFTSAGVAYTLHTFLTSGTFTVPAATPATLSGFTAGLTASFTLTANFGKPLATATETYFNGSTKYNRYYVLDNQNLVWVYDTQNESLYSASDNVSWFLPDYQTSYCTNATGVGVISGFLVVSATTGLYGKPVSLLGNTNTQTTTWTQFFAISAWQGAGNSAHYIYVGHQGEMYITDNSYIANVFPDSTIATTTVSSDNIQSHASWTISTTGNVPYDGIASVISGVNPITSDGKRVPAVFFTENGGILPTAITAGKVYYIQGFSAFFNVYQDPLVPDSSGVTLTGALSAGATSGTLTTAWAYATGVYNATFSNGQIIPVNLTKSGTTITWSVPISAGGATANVTIAGASDILTGSRGPQYYNSFYPIASAPAYSGVGTTPTFVFQNQRLTLPAFETAQCMAEIGNIVIIGCSGNVAYPWDQVQNLPSSPIFLPESNTTNIITVNQMGYIFTGNKANIYVTDGSQASQVLSVPDYAAGIPGSPATYIEPQFTWGGASYVRGRIYFSVQDQTSTKAGNCGGVWSFIPTQNLYIGQDAGTALRLENKNSYNTYNGMAPILITRLTQIAGSPLYWSAWQSDQSGVSYGIDYSTQGTSASFTTIVESDAMVTGTMLEKKTFKQIEYKLVSALDTAAKVTMSYRKDLTSAWRSCGTANLQPNRLSGYFPANFEKTQWLQIQMTITPITSTATTNSFVRVSEIRIR